MELYDNARFVIAVSSALSSIGVATTIAGLNRVVTELKAKGAIMPVRCKDCKHCIYISYACGDVRCGKLYTDNITENDFCSYGERREGE